MRRGFDIYNIGDKRLSGLSFEERLSFVLDRASREIKTAREYYQLRNDIAHGNAFATGIDVEGVVADLFILQGRISQ